MFPFWYCFVCLAVRITAFLDFPPQSFNCFTGTIRASDYLHHFCLSPFRLSGIPHLTQGCGWYEFSPVDLKSLYSMNRSFRHRRSVWNLTMTINPHVGFCPGNSIALLVRRYFGAQYLSLLSRCLRLAPNVTISNPKLTSGEVVSSFPDRISTCIIPSPFRAHCLTPYSFLLSIL